MNRLLKSVAPLRSRLNIAQVTVLAVLGMLWLAPMNSQATPVLWTVSGAFSPQSGSASGSFVFDADTQQFSSIDITTTTPNTFLNYLGDPAIFSGLVFGRTAGESQIAFNVPGVFLNQLTNAGGTFGLIPGNFAEYSCLPTCLTGGFHITNWASGATLAGTPLARVPEPATLALLALGLAGLGVSRRKL